MPRPTWEPTPEQKKLIRALRRSIAKTRAAQAEQLRVAAECDAGGIPIVHLATELGVERKTVYRLLGRPVE